jgi:hypothetical protein
MEQVDQSIAVMARSLAGVRYPRWGSSMRRGLPALLLAIIAAD